MLKNLLRFIITLAIIAGIAYGGYLFVMHTIDTHSFVAVDEEASPDDYFVMEITPGMRVSEVLEILYEQELIRHELIARLLLRLHDWGRIRVGSYRIYAGMSLEEMFELFDSEYTIEEAFNFVIIPEGTEIEQIAYIFANAQDLELEMDADELLELWADETFLTELIDEFWFLTNEILNPELIHPLEGYFYPIRHEIPEELEDERHMTRAMLRMTERMFAGYRTQMEEHDWTVHEILTFASIVQGETANVPDMANIAGVFQNRYEISYPLRSCVTVHYIYPGERQTHVTNEMAAIESPFNTYIVAGLPPGPVSSPERSAIDATLNPADHDYFFFIGDIFNCVDGGTMFSRTFAEHDALVTRYLNPGYAGQPCPTD